jgi:hypothetical protein
VRRLRLPIVLCATSVAIGIGLRAVQYFAAASLWMDELALVNALEVHRLSDLGVRPIAFGQIAPLGYDFLVKFLLLVRPTSELTLRLPSFLLGCAAVPLTGLVANRTIAKNYAWAATLGVALAPSLIFQSAQVKPYSGDVALSLLLLWLALGDFDRSGNCPGRALVAAGLLAPWFSFPSLFVLAALSLAWIVRAAGAHEAIDRPRTALTICCWGAACVVSLVLAQRLVDPTLRQFMRGFWAGGFPPPSSGPLAVAAWLSEALSDIIRGLTADRGGRPLAALAFLGIAGTWGRSPAKATALGMPIAFGVCAAVLSQYPLIGRASLWAMPILIIASLCGAVVGAQLVLGRDRVWPAAVVPCAFATAAVLAAFQKFPVIQRKQDLKPVLRHMASSAQPGDAVYVHYGAWHAATFYREMLQQPSITLMEGSCSPDDRRHPLLEIDQLRDHSRIWVLFSFLDVQHTDRKLILAYLDAIGVQRQVEWAPERDANAFLYELDRAKMARIPSASQWAIPDSLAEAPPRKCSLVLVPARLND